MIIKNIKLVNFKNISAGEVDFNDKINVFYGMNAQGKTNFLESLYLLSGQKSLRNLNDDELIKFGEKRAKICANLELEEREQKIEINIAADLREYNLNEINVKPAKMAKKVPIITFLPTSLEIIKGAPGLRRQFLDAAIGKIMPKYLTLTKEYERNLKQRNAVLKEIKNGQNVEEMLQVFDERVAHLGSKVVMIRLRYVDELLKHAKNIYDEVAESAEIIDVKYAPKDIVLLEKSEEIVYNEIMQKLRENLHLDVQKLSTGAGPHRDDLLITINELDSRKFASQGQQRSLVLTLKFAECEILRESLKEEPIILLDDVFSELDEMRQGFVLKKSAGLQVFITSCNKDVDFLNSNNVSFFKVESGEIINK